MSSCQSSSTALTSSSTLTIENPKEQLKSSGASPQKVSEVFLVAGQAFQKLGGLIASLQNPNIGRERKWTNSDTNDLHDAVARFADDLQRISETVHEREVQLIKEDIIKRPATSHYVKSATLSRTNGSSIRPTAVTRPLLKRTSSISHASADSSFKRRIVTTYSGSTAVSNSSCYATIPQMQPSSINSLAMARGQSVPFNVFSSNLATVTVHSTPRTVFLPSESAVQDETNNLDNRILRL
ncbi:unnamed protein product [Thelazia callipaeda]|uniref:Syntaxin-32 n=1 Tax=Thelazia callipaeda TaxID=103827 RepID=A0A0N5CPQ3_THECL|nr:unnamed protein product [Thelazia callipaeda]